jgi:hypothetical protein
MADQETTAPENGASAPGAAQEIVRVQPKQLSRRDPAQLAKAAAASGFWKHIQTPAQAVVVMAAGEELGLTPLASLQGITIIEGEVGYRANLIATLIAQHKQYSYKVIERKDDRCTLQFEIDGKAIEDGEEGKVTFTLDDAKEAELVKPRSGWAKYPRRMCFWRCLTEGAGIYFADLTAGTPVYTDEEIREVIHVEVEVEAVDQEDPPTLPPERVDQLVKGFEIAGPELGGVNELDGLNVLLGSLGVDGWEPGCDVGEEFSKLSPEIADQIEAEFQAAIDRAASEPEKVDQHEGGEADADA